MALIKLGATVTDISGKVGGTTFGNGPAGPYMKNTGSYINSQTSKRKEANQALTAITSHWRTLSALEKLSWEALSASFPYTNRVGDVRFYSGFNLFTQFNYNLVLWGDPIVDSAPAVSTLIAPASVGITVVGRTVTITSVGGSSAPVCKVYVSAGISAGSNQYKSNLRFLAAIENFKLQLGQAFTVPFESVFGVAVAGMKYFVEVHSFDDISGQPLGTFVSDSVIAIP